jgi:hypothetical protein
VKAVLLAVALALVSIAATTTSTPTTSPVGAAEPWVLSLPGHPDIRFSAYDFRQDGFGAVDWPAEFVFHGNVTIDKIADALCHTTPDPWRYCDSGGPMHLFVSVGSGSSQVTEFAANSGVKRFEADCQSTRFTAHMRLYTAKGNAGDASLGSVVIGTAHLDFEDHAGCSGRIHGYPDIAQQWFNEALSHVPGWQVTPDAWDLGNGSDDYIILRDLSGALVPHVYGHDAKATDVVVP